MYCQSDASDAYLSLALFFVADAAASLLLPIQAGILVLHFIHQLVKFLAFAFVLFWIFCSDFFHLSFHSIPLKRRETERVREREWRQWEKNSFAIVNYSVSVRSNSLVVFAVLYLIWTRRPSKIQRNKIKENQMQVHYSAIHAEQTCEWFRMWARARAPYTRYVHRLVGICRSNGSSSSSERQPNTKPNSITFSFWFFSLYSRYSWSYIPRYHTAHTRSLLSLPKATVVERERGESNKLTTEQMKWRRRRRWKRDKYERND